MKRILLKLALAGLIVPPAVAMGAGEPGIDAFNRAVIDATKSMDNAATLALWEDDGVSILPSTPAIVGKPAIAAFLKDVTSRFPGAKMESFTLDCVVVASDGDFAAERCVEHQVVNIPGGKPFDGHGNILYVLHRSGGRWRIRAEMWNAAAGDAK